MLNMAVDMLNIIVPTRPTNPSIIKGLKQPTQLNKQNASALSKTMEKIAKQVKEKSNKKKKNPLDKTDECDHKKDLKCNLEELQGNKLLSRTSSAQTSPYTMSSGTTQIDFTV